MGKNDVTDIYYNATMLRGGGAFFSNGSIPSAA